MRYFKLATGDKETRWINLAQVSRITLAPEGAGRSGPVLAVFFANASPEAKLEVHGTSSENRKAIQQLTAALDAVVDQR